MERTPASAPANVQVMLQWGHDRMTMESQGVDERLDLGRVLQWGHDRMTMESVLDANSVALLEVLQWGHDRMTMERPSMCSAKAGPSA